MEVKLIGAIDYKKVEKLLEEKISNKEERERLLQELKQIEISRRSEIVSSAGRLSRASGTVLDVLGLSENKTLEQNAKFAQMVIGMGHSSICDHDYCVFAIKDVSPIVEQTIIEERFSSFTIKSRREADFSSVGYYVPDFHGEDGKILPNNEELQKEYKKHMQMLFDAYSALKEKNIPQEDARFILPYCYHSNIMMGMDAHCVKDLIIKLTKTKYANITELKEFGEKLYAIAQEQMPYIISEIDKAETKSSDPAGEYLSKYIPIEKFRTPVTTRLLNCSTKNIDDTILISAIMRRYQFTEERAKQVYEEACEFNPNFKKELMKKIAFDSDGLELTQVNFQFETSLSLAILTHLTRHRTHDLITPDFVPNLDLEKYKTPPSIMQSKTAESIYNTLYALNLEMYERFKETYGVREEDLIYFTLSGTIANVLTNMDGKTLKHILSLRECTKAQWETRQMANSMHKEIRQREDAEIFQTILGPSCITQRICNEGKESCGKIHLLKKPKP